ncbi:hypothetical protein [Bradyrhizobium sp. NC92]|uniref:hypothetical protein n=1 Tax=Bradyrhizobium sp. (strain NC92) TaxID=55395 RepID=UPI0021A9A62A|nr:hypothetical protein [Bradyrhizobium sp. NC92]UWU67604.1 hypothetical protein N2602_30845 [Bradyrhizobium sp. NC92]
MNEQRLASALKGWLASCFAAAVTLFLAGLINQVRHPSGLTPATLAVGIFVAFVHLTFILMITAAPAAAVVLITSVLHLRSIAVFAVSGAGVGWLGQRLITPWPDTTMWTYVFAGFVAGCTYWFVAVRREQSN